MNSRRNCMPAMCPHRGARLHEGRTLRSTHSHRVKCCHSGASIREQHSPGYDHEGGGGQGLHRPLRRHLAQWVKEEQLPPRFGTRIRSGTRICSKTRIRGRGLHTIQHLQAAMDTDSVHAPAHRLRLKEQVPNYSPPFLIASAANQCASPCLPYTNSTPGGAMRHFPVQEG